jgi:glycosyltransferase involved in cell wall biosynthesis
MLKLRTSGIYHTDFPQYVRILTDDKFLETMAWNYMYWFYSQLDLFYVNSEHYRQCWVERGIPAEKIKILPRGLDTRLFSPERRSAEFRNRCGTPGDKPLLLYVGRISKEKDLDVLAESYAALDDIAHFVLVGDGPYVDELKRRMPKACFTGYLSGEALATAYASADVFLFPSTTDTFGNVVIEAMACGLPNVVSDMGGPRELVEEGVTGFITRSLDAADFTAAARKLIEDESLRRTMGANAREAVRDRNWSSAFRKFWAMSEE